MHRRGGSSFHEHIGRLLVASAPATIDRGRCRGRKSVRELRIEVIRLDYSSIIDYSRIIMFEKRDTARTVLGN